MIQLPQNTAPLFRNKQQLNINSSLSPGQNTGNNNHQNPTSKELSKPQAHIKSGSVKNSSIKLSSSNIETGNNNTILYASGKASPEVLTGVISSALIGMQMANQDNGWAWLGIDMGPVNIGPYPDLEITHKQFTFMVIPNYYSFCLQDPANRNWQTRRHSLAGLLGFKMAL